MIVSWKLVRTSIAMSACLGLLAACQDRGQFKSKKWTPEQIQANLAAKNARQRLQNGNPSSTDPIATPVATDPGGTPNMPSTRLDPAAPATPGTKPGEIKPAVNTGSASGIVIQEEMLARDKFIEENNQRMKEMDPAAVKVFKGTSAVFAGTVGNLSLTLDLGIQLGDEVRFISVGETPVKFSEKDTKATKLTAMIKDIDGSELVMNDQQLAIFATCKDAVCSELHVRVQVAVENGSATLAFVMRPVDKSYQIIDSNLKDQMISFDEFTKALETGKKPAAKASENKPEEIPTKVIGDENKAAPEADQSTAKGDKNSVKNGGEGATVVNKTAPKDGEAAAAPAKEAAPVTAPVKSATKSQSVVFKPATDTSASKPALNLPAVDAPAVIDVKPAAKPLPVQDPGTFSFPTQKAPGIFGSATGLTGAAVQSKPAATAAPKAAVAQPAATVDTSSADAQKENEKLAEVLKQEKEDQLALDALSAYDP